MVPERQHHQILRMGQPKRLEQRPVDGEHGAIGDGQREAHLTFERERVDALVEDGHTQIVR